MAPGEWDLVWRTTGTKGRSTSHWHHRRDCLALPGRDTEPSGNGRERRLVRQVTFAAADAAGLKPHDCDAHAEQWGGTSKSKGPHRDPRTEP